MTCKKCKLKPVFNLPNSNIVLCKSCFIRHIEKNAFKTIRAYKLVSKRENMGVAVSGGKDSLSLLCILNKLAVKNRNLKITPILIDEGIKGYRKKTIKDAKRICNKLGLKLNIYSFKKEFGKTLDEIIKKTGEKPCSLCGVLRRYLLNKYSRRIGVTKLATGHNLDDEAQSIIMNQFRNNIAVSARLGPLTGVREDPKFIRRIKPFYHLTEREIAAYSYLKGFVSEYSSCPYEHDSYRAEIRDMLNNFEQKHPGTKQGIIKSFLAVLPILKDRFKDVSAVSSAINKCKKCKEPCSGKICQKCRILDKLKDLTN